MPIELTRGTSTIIDAVDDDLAGEAETVQSSDDPRKIDLPRADRHLLPELPAIRGVEPVLGVEVADVPAEHVERVERVGLAVEDQVGRIEIHGDVRQVQLFEERPQGVRRFLAGFGVQTINRVLVVGIAHGWGDPEDKRGIEEKGSNAQRLIPDDVRYDPVTGLALMTAVPVNVIAAK